MKNYTMMGASSVDATPNYDNSGVNPNPTSATEQSSNPSLAETQKMPTEGSSESVDTSDIPNTPDNIAEGQKQTSYAMIVAAIALVYIFLRKKKK